MEKLFKFLKQFFQDKFFGTVVIRFEHGKVTHVEVQSKRVWQYKDLPVGADRKQEAVDHGPF